MQIRDMILSATALALLATAPALAAGSALGRITYIYPDGRHLILDSNKEYALAPSVNVQSLGVAEFVRLTLGPNNEVTNVASGPANQAAYWAPRG
jgi:hypothetical protein